MRKTAYVHLVQIRLRVDQILSGLLKSDQQSSTLRGTPHIRSVIPVSIFFERFNFVRIISLQIIREGGSLVSADKCLKFVV